MGLFCWDIFFFIGHCEVAQEIGSKFVFLKQSLCPIRHNVDPVSYDVLVNRTIHAFPHLSFPNLSVSSPSAYCRNRSMAVLSGALLSGEAAKAAVSCCSRPNLLEVSLPSPTLACLHARPKLPCYAG